jgi:TRAP-type C4-dicarboxylate transport system permease small subunit
MMLLIVADIVLRGAFNKPIQAGVEIIELMMVCVVYLGLAYTQSQGGFVRMEVIISRLPSSATWYTEYLNYVLIVAFFCLFCWRGILLAIESLATRELTFGIVPVPVYPARVALAAGGILILIEVIVELVLHHRGKKQWLQS